MTLPKKKNQDDDDDEFLYVSYLKLFKERKCAKYRNLICSFNRFLIVWLGTYICNCDLMGGCEPTSAACNSCSGQPPPGEPARLSLIAKLTRYLKDRLPKPVRRSSWRRKLKCGWIPNAFLVAFFIATLILLLDLAYLYKHDISRLRLKRVQELIELHGERATLIFDGSDGATYKRRQMSLGEYEKILKARIAHTRHVLRYLGDRFIGKGILIEFLYLYGLALSVALYLIPQMIFTWVQQFDIPFHRDLLDREDESRRADAQCEDEVLKYIESNRVHATVHARYKIPLSTTRGSINQAAAADDTSNSPSSTSLKRQDSCDQHAEASGSLACRLLTQMLTAGALRSPLRSNLWLDEQNRAQFMLLIVMTIYSIPFPVSIILTLYDTIPEGFDLGETCIMLILYLAGSALMHFIRAFFVSCTTQIKLVNHNLSLISTCIQRNERQITKLSSGRSRQGRARKVTNVSVVIEKINSNFLFTLMTYKIFIRQWAPFKRALSSIFLVAFSMAFFVPVLLRTHVPYLGRQDDRAPDNSREIRVTGFIISLVIMLPINSICLPICHLHSRCQELYKALASLTAHLIRVNSALTSKTTLYNKHAVGVLLREIAQPEEMLEQFIAKSLGIGASYPALVRLHFWWGLVALSILVDSAQVLRRNQGDPLSSFIADPLGVWNFHV